MALRELDYQGRVLARLDDYLTELASQKKRADEIARLASENPGLGLKAPDFTAETWEALRKAGNLPISRQQIPCSPRLDGLGRPVPNIVFKVPTGGGKTFLAVAALSKIFGRFIGRNKGFVLWIVPNEAIYAQTKRQLTDRQHPYRQMLDVLSGNAVRILEKGDQLDARDVESHLCVMLLMLQSGNRENKESLRMFRDRGDVHGFFPPEGDQEAHAAELDRTPNLDCYDLGNSAYPWPQIKDSLGNALRLVRPVVVMDEGHKAVSELAFSTLYGFNPCFVLELTATPKDVQATTGKNPKPARHSNVLVEVQGIDLDREGMIKMPLNLDPRSGPDWHATLAAALGRLRQLDAAARELQADTGRYIRPILLVQVERTGNDQRDGAHIHALDVMEWLTNTAGLDEAEIAIKTADTNDLAAPENQELLSPLNRIRVIITKQALQEGWDCPFAYVLCALAASANLSAMTQLVGRILRQPSAQKTGVPLLDESYVITHHADTAKVVEAIKKGLEEDGMGDLVREIRSSDSTAPSGPRTVHRRPKFASTKIYLPLVLRVEDDEARTLRYEGGYSIGHRLAGDRRFGACRENTGQRQRHRTADAAHPPRRFRRRAHRLRSGRRISGAARFRHRLRCAHDFGHRAERLVGARHRRQPARGAAGAGIQRRGARAYFGPHRRRVAQVARTAADREGRSTVPPRSRRRTHPVPSAGRRAQLATPRNNGDLRAGRRGSAHRPQRRAARKEPLFTHLQRRLLKSGRTRRRSLSRQPESAHLVAPQCRPKPLRRAGVAARKGLS
ncbi:MAG: DEAD/DEAH box helicase [Chlorobaculum sp.]